MTITIDIEEFHKSINKELEVVQDRVRNLIGSAHWGEEGKFKEAVLKNVISRFLPKNYSIGTGFVLTNDKELSTQIDIIIYDNTFPLLFSQGDFVIVTPDSVCAIIEVKTKIDSISELKSYMNKLTANAHLIEKQSNGLPKLTFVGIFSYENGISERTLKERYSDLVPLVDQQRLVNVNHVSLGKDYFIKYWDERKGLEGYKLENLSFSYFIFNIFVSFDPARGLHNDRLFFVYPNKEGFKIFP